MMTTRNSLYSIISVDRRQEEDQRKIERFTSPPIREHLRQTNICVRFLYVLTLAGAVYSLVHGFSLGGADDISFGFFMGVVFGLLTVFLFRYSAAIQDYMFNESVSNFDKAMERQSLFWMIAVFMSVIWTLVYFVLNS